MILVEGGATSAEELAAILGALQTLRGDDAPTEEPRTPAWSLAMRLPDLEIDDLRALAGRSCSPRF